MRLLNTRPGRFAPAFLLAAVALGTPMAAWAQAQPQAATPQAAQPPISIEPVPNELELAKLLWSTMTAVHHANLSGNYSVLRDISSPGFQVMNNAARLGEVFASIRQSRVDLSSALLLAPTYTEPPSVAEPGVIRVRGYFGLRPTALFFDFFFQWVEGRWRLHGVAISPQAIASEEAPERGRNSTR